MSFDWIIFACFVFALSSALVAGVLHAFSDFLMRGLVQAEGGAGAPAMQAINRAVLRSQFVTTFLVLTPASIAFAIYAALTLDGAARQLLIAAAVVYGLSVFVVTAAANVPMNKRLEALPPTGADTAAYWARYAKVWTGWNTVRSVGAITTAGCYLGAAAML